MKWTELHTESCPVARGLSVIGDRWTMLVIRECFLGVRRFDQMQARLGITRHVLADRLRKLEADGVLRRDAYQDRPLRHEYRLTEKGKALHPILVTLIDWANQNVPTEATPMITLLSRDTERPIRPRLVDEETGAPITHLSVTAKLAE
ncbi:transcriptional regulator [Pseudooceanicola sediminis]|uniref:Transcriptional regulator n=1 Tax=Pseudooceanicola sediminis TaxID=2211117 RepID=A0A399IYU4_9RHOB|nr:helix-turn-helix domain-containing protein [Pseudooceanicola sediminis]KAA2316060.1 helix-turn-helix transcriptional regulator [Puniceibacterium sp. HSS470]RII38170.1 transcriptional regulator [Pseudooceanicola sediminis]|tara:strand:+ start:12498 stop:12941 length:444 start_codon:yes stop_codon:yes gene_type:complete